MKNVLFFINGTFCSILILSPMIVGILKFSRAYYDWSVLVISLIMVGLILINFPISLLVYKSFKNTKSSGKLDFFVKRVFLNRLFPIYLIYFIIIVVASFFFKQYRDEILFGISLLFGYGFSIFVFLTKKIQKINLQNLKT